VYGVLYTVAKAEKPKLDAAEGLGHGYEEKTVSVISGKGTRSAVMYYAKEKDPLKKPYHWYKAFVVAGAVEHGLPFPYVEWLRTVDSEADQDARRRIENERLLISKDLAATSARQARQRSPRAKRRRR
jgi:gamma-glutamylcyclotransferase